MTKIFESAVEYNSDFDEYYVTLPDELTTTLGWEEGDVVEWQANKDGTVLLVRTDDEFTGETENDEN